MSNIGRACFKSCLVLAFLQPLSATVIQATFADRVEYRQCGGLGTEAVADTNGDGIPDIICGGIQVFFGNGDGTFRDGPISNVFLADYSSMNPVAIDLNGDGKVDLVIVANLTNEGPAGVGVTFGNGDGTFQPATFYQAGNDAFFYRILLGDFNNDGIPDIATLGELGVWVFIGQGGGLFNPGTLTPISAAQSEEGFVVSDLNADGNLDLVAAAGHGFDVLLGNGNGTFQTPLVMSAEPLPFADAIAAADLNGDGKPDLVVSSQGAAYSLILLGNGDGTFAAPQEVDLPGESDISVADLNGDGIPDLVNSGVYVAFGKGHGKFASTVYFPVSGSADSLGSLLVADLLNDGHPDLLVGDYYDSLSVLLNQGKGTFEDGNWTKVSGGPLCAASADFNGDGKPDLAVGLSAGIAVLLGTDRAVAPLLQSATLPVTDPSCPLVGDVNGDGFIDIVISSGVTGYPGSVLTFLGNGDGTFQQAISNALPTIGVVVLGDFNGDGKLDYATTSNLLGLGNGDGTFQTPTAYIPKIVSGTVAEFNNIASGHLTANRYSDIVLVNGTLGLVYVLLSGGSKGFKEQVLNVSNQVYLPVAPVLGDVNGDGFPDLVLGGVFEEVPIYLNDGTGKLAYSTSVTYALVDDASIPLVADVNGDGIPDIVVDGNYDLGIFLGEGAMTFAPPFYIGHGTEPGGVLALDLHGQSPKSGKPDLVVPDFTGAVEVIYNTTP